MATRISLARAYDLLTNTEVTRIRLAVQAEHHITHQPGTMGTTKSVCSCGIDNGGTLSPQHLPRWDRAHRQACVNDAVKDAARAILAGQQ